MRGKERYLDEWMTENAFVASMAHPEPWVIERLLLGELSCPLNIKDNRHHPFAPTLNQMRIAALRRAERCPSRTSIIRDDDAQLPNLRAARSFHNS